MYVTYAVVLLCGWILSPWYAFFSAGIGSALADIFSGYVVYAPVTFIIKGIMAVVVGFINKKKTSLTSKIIGGIIAEIIMVLGYFVFEGFMYGFIPSIVNIPANSIQGVAGIIIGIILIKIFEKAKLN